MKTFPTVVGYSVNFFMAVDL